MLQTYILYNRDTKKHEMQMHKKKEKEHSVIHK